MMTSERIVERFNAKLKGQQLLFEDPDIVLRNTKFRPLADELLSEAQEMIIHWWMNVYVPDGRGDNHTPQEIFSSWSNAKYHYFKFCQVDGYCPDIQQSAIHLKCYKQMPLAPQVRELQMWLEPAKSFILSTGRTKKPTDRVGKYVSIFEHTLSRWASYYLYVYSDDTDCAIYSNRYGRYSLEKEFKTLESAVDYIRLNLWYESSDKEDQELWDEE